MVNRGIRRHITKTDLLKYVECTSLWNVKSSMEERKVARHASGMRRCIRRHAGHDFQDIVDNEAAQTAAASESEPNDEMQEQAAGGSASRSSGGPVLAAARPAQGGCQHGSCRELGTADEFCGSEVGG